MQSNAMLSSTMQKKLQKRLLRAAIPAALVSAALMLLQVLLNGSRYFLLHLFATVCFSICLIATVALLRGLWSKQDRAPLAIVGCIAFALYPILTRGFLFLDDYLVFLGIPIHFTSLTITQGRVVTGFFTDIFSHLTAENSFVARWVASLGVALYALLAYGHLQRTSNNRPVAFAFALLSALCIPSVGTAAAGVMMIYPWASLFSFVSYLCFERAYRALHASQRAKGWLGIALSVLLAVTAYQIYQPTALLGFVGLAIRLLFGREEEKKQSKFAFLYLVQAVGATALYFMSVRLLSAASGLSVMARGDMIGSPAEAVEKLRWFFQTVVYNTVHSVASGLIPPPLQGGAARDNLLVLVFANRWFGKLAFFVIAQLCICGLLTKLIVEKRARSFLLLVLAAVASYYPFLLLKENGFSIFYLFPLAAMLLLFALYGGYTLGARILRKRAGPARRWMAAALVAVLASVSAWTANDYLHRAWVRPNAAMYGALKASIAEGADARRHIHVYGGFRPYQADIYVTNASEIALRELGLNPSDYRVTTSTDRDHVAVVGYGSYAAMLPQMTEEEQAFFHQMYADQREFSLYMLRVHVLGREDRERLRQLFAKTGLLVDDDRADVVYVDLAGPE